MSEPLDPAIKELLDAAKVLEGSIGRLMANARLPVSGATSLALLSLSAWMQAQSGLPADRELFTHTAGKLYDFHMEHNSVASEAGS